MDIFHQDDAAMYMEDDPCAVASQVTSKPVQTYDEVVKELIIDEKQYLRDLHMITKVFRDLIKRQNIATVTNEELESIFSNINEVTEFTMTLIGSLEDTLEMTEEDKVPAIGSCFEEIAEAEDFDVYDKFSRDILSPSFQKAIDSLLSRPSVPEALQSVGHGFDKAVKYYLPVLLLGPVYHCFHYFKYIEVNNINFDTVFFTSPSLTCSSIQLLMNLTPSLDDGDTLKQVNAMVTPLQNKLQTYVQKAGTLAKRKSW